MARSKSSHRWLKEHFQDPYVKLAQKAGYRSRAAYKLIEIQERDRFIKPGMWVVELGAAPGGWSQLLRQWVKQEGRVIALDILPFDPLPGIEFIQGDFSEATAIASLLQSLNGVRLDLVLSDLAPNISGIEAVDQPRAMYLAELAWDFAQQVLKKDGLFLTKAFQGEGIESYIRSLRKGFKRVAIRKPKASRSRSREIYLLGQGFKL
jgi:23S rRNA (uridine2552-2'-O)-methyltransferase